MNEKQINKRLDEAQASFDRLVPGYTRLVKQAFDLARIRVTDILVKHTVNGKIPVNRLNAISRELTAVEDALYKDLLSQTKAVVEDAAGTAGEGLNGVLVTAVGVTALTALQEPQQGSTAVLTAGVLLAIGMAIAAFVAKITSTVFNRTGDDGKDLRYRLRKLASDIVSEIRLSLRKSIRKREDYATVQNNVLQSFLDVESRIDRIIETEAHVAYRTGIAIGAEQSGLVQALKIVDFPHGSHGVHKRHKCYEYAHADEHGMGEGVYPVTTRKIRNPHPQCRSRLYIVLKEGVLSA